MDVWKILARLNMKLFWVQFEENCDRLTNQFTNLKIEIKNVKDVCQTPRMYQVSLKYSRVVSVAYPNRRGIASYVLFPPVRPHAR